MLEFAIKGNRNYWIWVMALLGAISVGFALYMKQVQFGLGITGMSRDVSWGFYIANFTYLVGVAAGGVMVVLPYYLHDYKAYGKITVMGEFLAIASLIMCMIFILVDLGTSFIELHWTDTTVQVKNKILGGLAAYVVGITSAQLTISTLRSPPPAMANR